LKICVLGLWHLGTVTAGCLAAAGHDVIGLDFDSRTIEGLQEGLPPVSEPGLQEQLKNGIKKGRLSFTLNAPVAMVDSDVLWVTYDTPVDSDDRADVQFVLDRVEQVLPHVGSRTVVLISSQLSVGSTRVLEQKYKELHKGTDATFAYSPENLRLGKAIAVFLNQDRVVVGIRGERGRALLDNLLRPFTKQIVWMSIESAEMTKHAVNAFLATSVSFINEIAVICEQVGADAKEVERGLKTESRIGPRAYLTPGGAFAGGTLARDISFLVNIGNERGVPTHLLRAVRVSNDGHRQWVRRKISGILSPLKGRTVAVWGLTYKPGTDTLRRSSSVELCEWLFDRGVQVRVHDPAVKVLPEDLSQKITHCRTALEALEGAVALVVATEWPEYALIDPDRIVESMRQPIVFDVNRFLSAQLETKPTVRYITIGAS
jgi:UDPglucose 6-dehydrogenase